MTLSPFLRRLAEARSAISGELSSTSRVVDVLLDLRQLAEGDRTVYRIDSILAGIPGRTVVTNEWWTARLDELEIIESSGVHSPPIASAN